MCTLVVLGHSSVLFIFHLLHYLAKQSQVLTEHLFRFANQITFSHKHKQQILPCVQSKNKDIILLSTSGFS